LGEGGSRWEAGGRKKVEGGKTANLGKTDLPLTLRGGGVSERGTGEGVSDEKMSNLTPRLYGSFV